MSSRLLSLALAPIAGKLLTFEGCNFSEPDGEPGIVPADSISWRVFGNPVSLMIGGIAAVLLEFGDARVRTGVWEHSSFTSDPRERLRRTGAAAMVTVFGARSEAEALASRVNAIHAQIAGVTASGEPYRGDDPELLLWVQATASFAFLAAYQACLRPLSRQERDLYYAEAAPGAALYGVADPPMSERDLEALFARVAPRLEPSAVIDEFLAIMRRAPILPLPFRPLQALLVRAAIELVPPDLRGRLGLGERGRLSAAEWRLVRLLAGTAAKVHVSSSPWALARVRLGLAPK